jgi:hypothetical protein
MAAGWRSGGVGDAAQPGQRELPPPLPRPAGGRWRASTPLIEDYREVDHGVTEQVEVGLKLVQALRLKLLKQPLGSPREPSCIMQPLDGRKARAQSAPQAAAVDPFEATADSRVTSRRSHR